MSKRIDALTPAQTAQMEPWADQWIAVGLTTGPADRPAFAAAAADCYRYAKVPWPNRVVWVPNPVVLALAAPMAAHLLETKAAVGRLPPKGAVLCVEAVVDQVVGGAVDSTVRDAVVRAVAEVVGDVVRGPVEMAALRQAIASRWSHYLGGQFWVGGWYYGGAFTSFFREVCGLELPGDLWDRARAYEATMRSACWWWPHREFVMATEHPTRICRELVDPTVPRGWGSHRLHATDGSAVAWNGFALHAVHGVQVPEQVVVAPETLTPTQIMAESNVEVRRIMLDRFGADRFLKETDAKVVDNDRQYGILRRADLPGDPDGALTMVTVLNSTPEPDGTVKPYTIRVPPTITTARAAVAWTFGYDKPADYHPAIET